MCVLLPAWLCLLLGLLPVELQSRAVTAHRAHRHRLNLPRTFKYPKYSHPATDPTVSELPVEGDNTISQEERHIIWRALMHKEAPWKPADPLPDWSHNVLPEATARRRGSRGRRHANGGRSHGGHLMRVGCVLGTCQVQNLSHRLYQLIGQSGREDSSPINPRSPHSYG